MTALDLDDDEALVIFEFLSRYQESGQLTVAHPGEDRALANLLCLLEKQLVAPFGPDYDRALAEARQRLSAPE